MNRKAILITEISPSSAYISLDNYFINKIVYMNDIDKWLDTGFTVILFDHFGLPNSKKMINNKMLSVKYKEINFTELAKYLGINYE